MSFELKLVLHYVGQHVLDVESGGTYLLRNEACSGHARSSVDFDHVDDIIAIGILRDDIVDADDAVAVQDVVYGLSPQPHAWQFRVRCGPE